MIIESRRPQCPKADVLGVGVSAINLPQATGLVVDGAKAGARGYIPVTGVHGVMEAQRDPEFRKILSEAWLVTPDGMPMTWVGRGQGHAAMDRVYGPDLMLEVFRATQDGSVRHFFYGGGDGVADELRAALEKKFPGVCVCGTSTPPFRPLTEEEESGLVARMEMLRPHIVWVGLSTPKQEKFMASMQEKLPPCLMIGVGAAFDFHTGRVPQAPRWMQRSGLEWLFRLVQEPRRLWKRYLINNPFFVLQITMQFLGLRHGK